jgi:hypothetical protein
MPSKYSKYDDTTVVADSAINVPQFDVTCVIGTVYLGDGDKTPRQAAFDLIATHGTDGTFNFPNEDGRTIHVTVETEDAKR